MQAPTTAVISEMANLCVELIGRQETIRLRKLRKAAATGTLAKALQASNAAGPPLQSIEFAPEDVAWAKDYHARFWRLMHSPEYAAHGATYQDRANTIEKRVTEAIRKVEPSYLNSKGSNIQPNTPGFTPVNPGYTGPQRKPIPKPTPPAGPTAPRKPPPATQATTGPRKPIPKPEPPASATQPRKPPPSALSPEGERQRTSGQYLHIGKACIRSAAMVLTEQFRCTPMTRGVDAIEEMLAQELARSTGNLDADTAIKAAMRKVSDRIAAPATVTRVR